MVHCVVYSRHINKSCSSYHTLLVAILNMLGGGGVQQLVCTLLTRSETDLLHNYMLFDG